MILSLHSLSNANASDVHGQTCGVTTEQTTEISTEPISGGGGDREVFAQQRAK